MSRTVEITVFEEDVELEIEPMSVLTAAKLTAGKNTAQAMEALINHYLEENGACYKLANVGDMNSKKFMERYGELMKTISRVNGFDEGD